MARALLNETAIRRSLPRASESEAAQHQHCASVDELDRELTTTKETTMHPTKTAKKNTKVPHLPKRNNRWKWMAGATASAAAATSASDAATMTITLANNYLAGITGPTGDHLNADLTGDGIADIAFMGKNWGNNTFGIIAPFYFEINKMAHAYFGVKSLVGPSPVSHLFRASATGIRGSTSDSGIIFRNRVRAQADGPVAAMSTGGPLSRSATIQVKFTDASINGGAVTTGSLSLTSLASVNNSGTPSARVTLNSLTYDTVAASVPDTGSSLALMALGAGGVIALRRRLKAA